ncbi:PREDICTED: torsin-like protein [Ceratosolen solmsi marchali]|uniref:Torsin-like protein n=1 Tax=Ceratosolen solmsi marchali TaxID=326594 RepID=A0AAJ6YHP0_9HYME|nr:PREDICTED: torsin-like protein [Ceratosolen solmsi marchali]
MNYIYSLILTIIFLSSLKLGMTFILESIAAGTASVVGYALRCNFYECCTDEYIPRNTEALKNNLQNKLYGQQIAANMVYSAVHSHVFHLNPKKPLVLSLHGLPGSGKNYIVTMIANALYKNGEKSKYYHFFNGRVDFPDDKDNIYKVSLSNKIKTEINNCARSMFVFDEVDKMPVGVLDILVPFLDYTSWNQRDKSKAIFIFLSNTGSNYIVKRMIQLWEKGMNRENATLQDFESLISVGAFNEEGGLFKSGTIESKLIDHHIPLLPLEEKQVIQCLHDVFEHWGINNPTNAMIQEALSHVTYGPPPHNIYSTSGCKRLDHKVSSIIYKNDFK